MRKAVFIDRDDTIIEDVSYDSDPARTSLISGAAEALRKLKESGYLLVVISNQAGIGHGYFTADDVERKNSRMRELFRTEGVEFDAIYYCPHKPEDNCGCRKPAPGLILKAARDLGIDLKKSAMIGDKTTDPEAGIAAGCAINIRISGEDAGTTGKSYLVAHDIAEACQMALDREAHS